MAKDIKQIVFFFVCSLTGLYCIVELVFALKLDSLALLADGFHNISDCVSIGVGWYAHRAKTRPSSMYKSYGYARAEYLGAFANVSFLLALSLYVTLEVIPQLIHPLDVDYEDGVTFLFIAGLGVVLNIVCAILLARAGIAHSHGPGHSHSHGHSHAKTSPSHLPVITQKQQEHAPLLGGNAEKRHTLSSSEEGVSGSMHNVSLQPSLHSHGHSHAHGGSLNDDDDDCAIQVVYKDKTKRQSRREAVQDDVNVYAMLIHVVGDVMSSFVVLFVGLILQFFGKNSWVVYVDPIASLVIVIIIVGTTLPIVRRIVDILMQSAPDTCVHLSKDIAAVEGVMNVHDLHVWTLVDGVTIGTVHIVCAPEAALQVSQRVREVFHAAGVHSATIQPEATATHAASRACLCVEHCSEKKCC